MSVELAKIEAFNPELRSIDECLAELEKYGNPTLGKVDSDGWYCKVKVFVTGKGAEFKVMSGFDYKTPKLAVNECYDRLIDSIKKIKEVK